MIGRNFDVKKIIIDFCLLILIVIICGGMVFVYSNIQEKRRNEILQYKENTIKKINSHYGEYVELSNNANLYKNNNGDMIEAIEVVKGETFQLEDCDISENTEYFKIAESEYYVYYDDVMPTKNLKTKDQRYKRYLVFNENVVSKENAKIYRNGELVYVVKDSFEKEIILKGDDGYYIEIFNELLFINTTDVLEVKAANNTEAVEANGIPVTVYHFIYLNGDTSCNEAICHSENQIREHFKYLSENNFFTMTTTELRYYLEGKLRVPEKSILVTIDDGARAWNFVPILEEYKINATLFLVSSWYEKERFKSDYLELASHTHNLHTGRVCPGGQGSALKCLDKTKLLADLKQSRETLNGTEAFCFPFYEYNDYGISAVREAGFKIAFIGGGRKATRGIDLYKVPRIPLTDYTTLSEYIRKVN